MTAQELLSEVRGARDRAACRPATPPLDGSAAARRPMSCSSRDYVLCVEERPAWLRCQGADLLGRAIQQEQAARHLGDTQRLATRHLLPASLDIPIGSFPDLIDPVPH